MALESLTARREFRLMGDSGVEDQLWVDLSFSVSFCPVCVGVQCFRRHHTRALELGVHRHMD